MTKFRPCIDLHHGQVKQIVGSTLVDDATPVENYVSPRPPSWFAAKYAADRLTGGHVIKLGPGNDPAATEAIQAYPGGLQIGGGISAENAGPWLDAGASHVILTSWLFSPEGDLRNDRLLAIRKAVGRERLVIDLSCKRVHPTGGRLSWYVAMNRWQTLTKLEISHENLDRLADYASEFLVHVADVEGLCRGIDRELVQTLGEWGGLPVTYAGGAASLDDIQQVESSSGGKVDVTVGSALDLFGGEGLRYDELVQWNRRS